MLPIALMERRRDAKKRNGRLRYRKGPFFWNVVIPHILPSYGTPTQSHGRLDTWLCHRGGFNCGSCLQRQLGTVALTLEHAVMREPLDIVLGSIILGLLSSVMISGCVTIIVIYTRFLN